MANTEGDWSTGILDCCGGDGFGKGGESAGASVCENAFWEAVFTLLIGRCRQRSGIAPGNLYSVGLWLLRLLFLALLPSVRYLRLFELFCRAHNSVSQSREQALSETDVRKFARPFVQRMRNDSI